MTETPPSDNDERRLPEDGSEMPRKNEANQGSPRRPKRKNEAISSLMPTRHSNDELDDLREQSEALKLQENLSHEEKQRQHGMIYSRRKRLREKQKIEQLEEQCRRIRAANHLLRADNSRLEALHSEFATKVSYCDSEREAFSTARQQFPSITQAQSLQLNEPRHWQSSGTQILPTTLSLSESVQYPTASQPNVYSQPGNTITLPLSQSLAAQLLLQVFAAQSNSVWSAKPPSQQDTDAPTEQLDISQLLHPLFAAHHQALVCQNHGPNAVASRQLEQMAAMPPQQWASLQPTQAFHAAPQRARDQSVGDSTQHASPTSPFVWDWSQAVTTAHHPETGLAQGADAHEDDPHSLPEISTANLSQRFTQDQQVDLSTLFCTADNGNNDNISNSVDRSDGKIEFDPNFFQGRQP
jgi:hypothetical protein